MTTLLYGFLISSFLLGSYARFVGSGESSKNETTEAYSFIPKTRQGRGGISGGNSVVVIPTGQARILPKIYLTAGVATAGKMKGGGQGGGMGNGGGWGMGGGQGGGMGNGGGWGMGGGQGGGMGNGGGWGMGGGGMGNGGGWGMSGGQGGMGWGPIGWGPSMGWGGGGGGECEDKKAQKAKAKKKKKKAKAKKKAQKKGGGGGWPDGWNGMAGGGGGGWGPMSNGGMGGGGGGWGNSGSGNRGGGGNGWGGNGIGGGGGSKLGAGGGGWGGNGGSSGGKIGGQGGGWRNANGGGLGGGWRSGQQEEDNKLDSGESSEENWPNTMPRGSRLDDSPLEKFDLLESFPLYLNFDKTSSVNEKATDSSTQQILSVSKFPIPAPIVAKSVSGGVDSKSLPETVQLKLVCPGNADSNAMCYYTLV